MNGIFSYLSNIRNQRNSAIIVIVMVDCFFFGTRSYWLFLAHLDFVNNKLIKLIRKNVKDFLQMFSVCQWVYYLDQLLSIIKKIPTLVSRASSKDMFKGIIVEVVFKAILLKKFLNSVDAILNRLLILNIMNISAVYNICNI